MTKAHRRWHLRGWAIVVLLTVTGLALSLGTRPPASPAQVEGIAAEQDAAGRPGESAP